MDKYEELLTQMIQMPEEKSMKMIKVNKLTGFVKSKFLFFSKSNK